MLWDSVGHCFEMIVLLVLIAVCAGIWPLLLSKLQQSGTAAFGTSQIDGIIVPVVSLVLLFLAVVTLGKVFMRWWRANSLICIKPPPPGNNGGERRGV